VKVQDNDDPQWVPMSGGNQGILERTPHNHVHNNIGGFMPNSNSPRDPIFMMHHGNIDRIWASWNALGRKNSIARLWLDMKFTNNFIAPNGQTYTKAAKDLLDTKTDGYTCDTLPKSDNKPVNPTRFENFAALLDAKIASKAPRMKVTNKLSARMQVPLQLNVAASPALLQPALTPASENATPRDVVAILSNIRIGANVQSIRVFVNASNVSLDTPDTDLHYVTTIAFLKHGKGAHAGHGSAPSTIVHLTETLQGLARVQPLSTDKISVQLVPVPKPGVAPDAVGEVTPASIEIAVI
jgi:tyrosinase